MFSSVYNYKYRLSALKGELKLRNGELQLQLGLRRYPSFQFGSFETQYRTGNIENVQVLVYTPNQMCDLHPKHKHAQQNINGGHIKSLQMDYG